MYMKVAESKTPFLHNTGCMVHKQSKAFDEALLKHFLIMHDFRT